LRKAFLGVLTGVLFFALAAIAWALSDNQVTYDAAVEATGPNTPRGKPDNMTYNGVLAIRTESGGQPNTAPLTEIFFAKDIKNNAKKFPACDEGDIDGQTEIPAKCRKAIVGTGTASALVGAPGSTTSIPQDLQVTAINGNKGQDILLALIGGAVTTYRTIPGHIEKLTDPVYGYKVGFQVPQELQEVCLPACSQIALTDFDVLVNNERTVKVPYGPKPNRKQRKRGKKRKTYKATYLQLKKCPVNGMLPSKAIVHFNNDDGSPGGPVVEDTSESVCPS
jgi:hypothetical protein